MTELQKITEAISSAKRIAIMGHVGGDADSYGSALGLSSGLSKLGKDVHVVTGEEYPDSLDFLFFYYSGEVINKIEPENVDLLIILDSSDLKRTSDPELAKKIKLSGSKIIQIDHHTKGDLPEFCDFSFVDSAASSASEIIYNVLLELNIVIDKNIATCLLAGIIGDTSSFQNQNTSKESFAVASELMKKGARLTTITSHIFGSKEVDVLKLWGLAMERLTVEKHYGVVSTYLTHDEIQNFGLSTDVMSGIVNFLNSIKGASVVMLITEEEKGTIKVSMRTRDEHADVASIAKQLGGGGHTKAAGFSFPGSLKILTEGKNSHIVVS